MLSVKRKEEVARLSSAERGFLMTVVTWMSASGVFVAPLIVFPRMRMKPELLNGTPPGTIAAGHPSGWIQTHIFTQWFHHFLMVTKPTTENPVVLILDGHYSQTRNLDEVELWLDNHQFQAVSSVEVGTSFGKAYLETASMQTAISGFRKCRIIPYNPTIFGAAISSLIIMDTKKQLQLLHLPVQQPRSLLQHSSPQQQTRSCSNIPGSRSNNRGRRFNIPGWKARPSVSRKKRCICITIRHFPTISFTRTIHQCETWRKDSSYITSFPHQKELQESLKILQGKIATKLE
ncbi:hypothetical protein ANN_24503 [Periplaneta americana]|uniref:Uncharacterized protein n=1 Tax=Periplaneta americana TaxID=6978 RepID=A0ABQ8S3K6_PERAM|nr:hypothetical protein ANN_24503 [Periplaneta americana]